MAMRFLSVTLPTTEENLALDEALLNAAESTQDETSGDGVEILRLWEPATLAVVVGSGSRIADEVNETACHERGIPVLRRISGGAAVVTGPGCLMYSLVLSLQRQPRLQAVDLAHQFVLGRMTEALRTFDGTIAQRGTSDLAAGDRKFSGNSIRIKRHHLLYHGTILYDFPLEVISACLLPPPRTPAYREGRNHRSFVTNLSGQADKIRQSLAAAWNADLPEGEWSRGDVVELVAELVAELTAKKYRRREWNYRR